jgi:shikimate dehydrogenase
MNIILNGMPGTGKSAIGKRLAEIMCREFADIDVLVELEAGYTIADMVRKKGWEYFREAEAKKMAEICAKNNMVIAVGGGAVTTSENRSLFDDHSTLVIHLKCDRQTACERISRDASRPPLTEGNSSEAEWLKVWEMRKDLYEATATITYEQEYPHLDKEQALYTKAIDLYFLIHEHLYPDHKFLAVIGRNISLSRSPEVHNKAFEAEQIKARYHILNLPDAILLKHLKSKPLHGASITIPFKEDVMSLLDTTAPEVRQIGACNTIVKNRNGGWEGHNTDYTGCARALTEITEVKGKTVLVVGAGGAARAVVYGMKEQGAHCVVSNRTHDHAEELARDFDIDVVPIEKIATINYDILINATSVSMPIDKSQIKENSVIYDINYQKPSELLSEAKKKDCIILDGFPMLVYQAAKAWEFWFDKPFPPDIIQEIIHS